MKLGFFAMPVHPVGRPLHETLQEDREMTIFADQLGFSEGMFGEHVTDAAETITSSLIFIAWLLNETKQIKLGSGTVNMPNQHPARVAAEVAMVDHMAQGRFMFGISPGGLLSDAEVFGNLHKDRTEMFLEAINTVLKIWESEPPYNIEGKYWTITTQETMVPDIGQGIIAKPYQRPHPPIVVTAVAPFSKGVTEAAARGWEPISANFLLPQWVKTHWPKYVEGCERAGRPAEAKNWRVAKSIFVADDMETARRYATGEDGPYYNYYKPMVQKMLKGGRANLFKADQNAPDSVVTPPKVVEDLVIWGTPEKVVEELLAFREYIGDFGTLLYASHNWNDKALAGRSMELMAEKVMPALNSHIGASSEAA